MKTASHSHGFTLLETLVVVALVALLSVGIASIFNTVGETITRGRRVSELNRSAAQLERVMRADFDRMTREGFLVIRNEYANGGQPVSLFDPTIIEGEPNRRARRIDEITFFAINEKGLFSSARQPMHPDLIARSNEAMVYYGHGKKAIRPIVVNSNPTTRQNNYFRPRLEDFNADPLASLGLSSAGLPAGQRNPNEFASDWAVLRHISPLVSPARLKSGLAEMDIPDVFVNDMGFPLSMLQDSRTQVAMMPAAQSPFMHIARQQEMGTLDPANPGGTPLGYRVDARLGRPARGSGLVDIIVSDLGEIASIVNHAAYADSNSNNPILYWPEDVTRTGTPFAAFFDPLSPSDRPHMQAWMLDAFPNNRKDENPNLWRERPRIRYESTPPLLSVEDAFLETPAGTPQAELERAYREADQVMLTSAIFAPRCTEFIVEWSYGLTDPNPGPTQGQLIWYGLPRYEDVNGNGSFDAQDVILALPFDGVHSDFAVPALVAATGRPASDFSAVSFYPSRDLISMGLPPASTPNPGPETEVAMFGYYDPGSRQLQAGSVGVTGQPDPDDTSWDANSLLDPSDDRPWFWPALIRVTMSIADATDPTIEVTHQIVFEVPSGGLDNK